MASIIKKLVMEFDSEWSLQQPALLVNEQSTAKIAKESCIRPPWFKSNESDPAIIPRLIRNLFHFEWSPIDCPRVKERDLFFIVMKTTFCFEL